MPKAEYGENNSYRRVLDGCEVPEAVTLHFVVDLNDVLNQVAEDPLLLKGKLHLSREEHLTTPLGALETLLSIFIPVLDEVGFVKGEVFGHLGTVECGLDASHECQSGSDNGLCILHCKRQWRERGSRK